MEIRFAKETDLDNWMNLVNQVKESFYGLETKEALDNHRNTVLDFIRKESALCAESDDKIVGLLLFSKQKNMLCFLAVDPQYRRLHIGEKLVSQMLSYLNPENEVIVTTYRESIPEGIAARMFYKRMGFVEGKLTEEFENLVQEFVLKR